MPRFIRAAFALLALIAIGRQLVLHAQAGFDVLNFFSYFTNLSNLFAAGVLLAAAVTPAPSRRLDILRFAAAVTMAIVGMVFALLLRNTDLGALLPWVNVVVHYIMPSVVVLDFILRPPGTSLDRTHLGTAALFPIAYLAYVLARGAAIGWYPYSFLNPANSGGYTGVIGYAIGIAATYFAVGALLLVIANRRKGAASTR